jgi:Flp pilus assembly protein TadG
MVEFALTFPLAALLLLGIVVVGILVKNQVALTNAVRNGARAAAICGSTTDSANQATLPNGSACTTGNLDSYIDQQLGNVDAAYFRGYAPANLITVHQPDGSIAGDGSLANCSTGGNYVQVVAYYQQPLYVPFLGDLLGDPTTNTKQLEGQGEAQCEQ